MYLKRNASEMIYHILLNQCPTDASYKLLNKCELEQNMLGTQDFVMPRQAPDNLRPDSQPSPMAGDGLCSKVCNCVTTSGHS